MSTGTWNVRGINRPGKVENIVSEAAAMQLDVCGLSDKDDDVHDEFYEQLQVPWRVSKEVTTL